MKHIKIILLGIFVLSASTTFAQDDTPWWKKLFKKDSVEEIEKDKTTDTKDKDSDYQVIDKDGVEPNKVDTLIQEVKFEPRVLTKTGEKGKITVTNPFPTDSIANKFKDKDYRGYRIQIYLGDLDKAKRTRAYFMSKKSYNKCYIEQRAPDYVVLVGNYRDLYEAHQSLFQLKREYPNAFIVDSEINL